jgi:hypothetical protein
MDSSHYDSNCGNSFQSVTMPKPVYCERIHGHTGACRAMHPDGPKSWICREDGINEEVSTTKDSGIDPVNHPPHYGTHPSGIECIDVVEHLNFCLGNAIKYIWRCEDKGNPVEDLKKARWYLDREIERRSLDGDAKR